MALRTQSVPVPIGGGIDRETHEFSVQAPNARSVENFSPSQKGALTKRSGSTLLSTVPSGSGSEVLVVRGGSDVALFNDRGGHYLQEGNFVTQAFGALHPMKVSSRPVIQIRGAASDANIAHQGGYTAVVCSVAEDPKLALVHNADAFQALCVVLDSQWRIVWGPHRITKLGLLPRVEPVVVSGTPGFIFTGLYDEEKDATNWALGAAALELHAVYVSTDTLLSPTPTLIASVKTYSGGPQDLRIYYDTHSASEDRIYVTYYQSGDGSLKIGSIPSNLTHPVTTAQDTGPSPNNMAIWRDVPKNTVLVYSQETNRVYTTTSAMGTPAFVSHPSSIPDPWPVFYLSNTTLFLNNRSVLLTGSSPATVSFGAAGGPPERILHRRPQPHPEVGSVFFRRYYSATNGWDDRLETGGESLSIIDTREDLTQDNRPVLLINQSRLDQWYTGHFHKKPGLSRLAGTLGQSCLSDQGAFLTPSLIVSRAFLPHPFHEIPENPFSFGNTLLWLDEGEGGVGGLTSVMDSAKWLVVSEATFDTSEFSVVDHYSTALVAAGGLWAWDGRVSFEATLPHPISSSANDAGVTHQKEARIAGAKFNLGTNEAVSFVGVLTFLDRNGVKYRSPSFFMSKIRNEGAPIELSLRFELDLHPAHLLLQDTGGLVLEVYTAVGEELVPGDFQPTSHDFTFRGPVHKDGGGFFVDGQNIVGASIKTPTQVYTDSGELPPQQVPASSVLSRAGNYLFLIPQEDPYEIWHSKPIGAHIGPEFNALLSFRLPPESGGAVSLAGESDRLIILCRNAVYELFVGGEGPDATGVGSFPSIRQVWEGEGCISHKGTTSGPFGTFFVSESGPKIVSRDSQLVDTGVLVKGLLDVDSVVAAVRHDAAREVWLFQVGGPTLVWDTSTSSWSTSDLLASTAAPFSRRLLRVDFPNILQETSGEPRNNGQNVLAKYVGPWVSLGDHLSFKRIREVAVLVERISGNIGKINIDLEYDYVPGVVDTFAFDVADFSTFDRLATFKVKPSKQKATSVRVTVRESGDPSKQGEPSTLLWALVGISLRVGLKESPVKLQAGASK